MFFAALYSSPQHDGTNALFLDFSGHFERRISFGYDADLAQVRAEFDGVMLRIAIPRRVSPITWNANASSRMGRI